MQRITSTEAKNYTPLKDDFTSNPPEYFTLTNSLDKNYPSSEGWQDVLYYTGHKVDLYSNRKGDGDSWVYILSNPSIPNQYKIGSTSKTPDIRAKQIAKSTGVPTPFIVEFGFHCFNAETAEREIHKSLKGCRVSRDKEFFKISLIEAKQVVETIGAKYI